MQTLPSHRNRRLGFFVAVVFGWLCVGLVQAQITIGTSPDVSVVGPGHSAHWFNPERAGEGIALEILENDRAQMYWFTYDEQGNQRWLIGTGELVTENGSTTAVFPGLITTRGGRFGPEFDPEEVELENVGTATMSFLDCNEALFTYEAIGQQETLPMTRLSRTMGVDCAQPIHGRALFPVTDDARLSGSWFDPERSGQGFSLQWLDRDAALLTWYTYDDQGNQRWMIGQGQREGDQIVFEALQTSRGGRFGPDFDPDAVELLPWGEVIMTLDCDSGTMTWDSLLPEFGQGGLSLSRLTRLEKLGCVRHTPTLLDLYDAELVAEIPVDSPGFPINNRVSAMSDDGSVVLGAFSPNGFRSLWRWEMGDGGLDVLPRQGRGDAAVLTPDGSTIYAALLEEEEGPFGPLSRLYSWTISGGWNRVPDTFTTTTRLDGVSAQSNYLVGLGRRSEEVQLSVWTWGAELGQQEIVVRDGLDYSFSTSGGVSDDGRVIVGVATDFSGPPSSPRRDRALRWIDGLPDFLKDASENSLLMPFGCMASCEVIFGGGHNLDADLPELSTFRQAWLRTDAFGAEYVGRLPDATDLSVYDAFLNASADGNLLVGDYPIEFTGSSIGIGTRGMVWTRSTGLQPLTTILNEIGVDDSAWENTGIVDVSSDGLLWLVSMRRNNGSGSAVNNTFAAILKLTPRVQPYE